MDLRKKPVKHKFVLTKRDKDLVFLRSNGLTAKQVSEISNISPRTVEKIISILLVEYGCNNITHLAATFIRKGLIK
jgi:DNA-binding CsgD family transcriptional regulator